MFERIYLPFAIYVLQVRAPFFALTGRLVERALNLHMYLFELFVVGVRRDENWGGNNHLCPRERFGNLGSIPALANLPEVVGRLREGQDRKASLCGPQQVSHLCLMTRAFAPATR